MRLVSYLLVRVEVKKWSKQVEYTVEKGFYANHMSIILWMPKQQCVYEYLRTLRSD
jgi:hypothetical protein